MNSGDHENPFQTVKRTSGRRELAPFRAGCTATACCEAARVSLRLHGLKGLPYIAQCPTYVWVLSSEFCKDRKANRIILSYEQGTYIRNSKNASSLVSCRLPAAK